MVRACILELQTEPDGMEQKTVEADGWIGWTEPSPVEKNSTLLECNQIE